MALLAYDKIAPENEANLPKVLDSKYIDWDETTLKTINNESIIGEGNIEIKGGASENCPIRLRVVSHTPSSSSSGKKTAYLYNIAPEDEDKLVYETIYYYELASGAIRVYKDGSIGGETNYNETLYQYKAVSYEWEGVTRWQCIFSPSSNWGINVNGNTITLPTGCMYWGGNGTLANLTPDSQPNFIANSWIDSGWLDDQELKDGVGYELYYPTSATTIEIGYGSTTANYQSTVKIGNVYMPIRRENIATILYTNCPTVFYYAKNYAPTNIYLNNTLTAVEGSLVRMDVDTNTTYSLAKLGMTFVQANSDDGLTFTTASVSNYTNTTAANVVCLFNADVKSGATLSISSKTAYKINFRNATITDGIIKKGDICTFNLNTSVTTTGREQGWHLTSIDRTISEGGGKGATYFGTQSNTTAPASTLGTHTVTVGEDYKLEKGAILTVKMIYPLGIGAKLKVDETAAKNIRWRGQNILSISFYAGDTITYMFDGTFYNIISCDRLDNGATRYAKCTTPTDTILKEVTLSNFTVETGKIIVINFTNGFDQERAAQIKFINGATSSTLDVYYQGQRLGVPIEDGDTATFVIAAFDSGIRYLDLQGVNKIGDDTPQQQINIADSQNYNINDDESVPTVKAASDMINSRIIICSESEYLAMTKSTDTIYFITV